MIVQECRAVQSIRYTVANWFEGALLDLFGLLSVSLH